MIVLPLNRCHDSSQYSPSSSLSASCNDCAGIFKRLADTAFLFFSRFRPATLLDYKYTSFCRSRRVLRLTRSKILLYAYALPVLFCFVLFCFFCLVEANRQDLFFFISCFLHSRPFDDEGIGTQTISCQNITTLLCHTIFSALLTDDCQHVIRGN